MLQSPRIVVVFNPRRRKEQGLNFHHLQQTGIATTHASFYTQCQQFKPTSSRNIPRLAEVNIYPSRLSK